MVNVQRKEGESPSAAFFRFSKRVRQSGILAEARKRRFRDRAVNRRKRRLSAIFRATKKQTLAREKKLGIATDEKKHR